MKKILLIPFVLSLCISLSVKAQTLYVDAIKGKQEATGKADDPLSSLEKVISMTNNFSGNEPVIIKIAPGFYVLEHELTLKTSKVANDTLSYTIEAAIMPDDPDWQPGKMPVIQSISANNSNVQFPHCVSFLVAKSKVSFKGLKFVGNANPFVEYYYPITRERENLKDLEVSQCYFIGEKNSSRLQSGVWANGDGIHVDHCIFYNCRNAMVLIRSISGFSLTHSIIYGAYESGIWYGASDAPFVFNNNIITRCAFVWVRPDKTQPTYHFNNSLIVDNDQYLGFIANDLFPATTDKLMETGIRKNGKILFIEPKTKGLPHDYLNLSPESDGKDLNAGIFKKAMKNE